MITLLATTAIIFLVLKNHLYYLEVNAPKMAEELQRQAEDNGLHPNRILARKNWGLALDKTQSRLLYITVTQRKLKTMLLDLNKIKYCSILHTYTRSCSLFSMRGTKNRKYLDCILLNIQYTDSNYQIPFYSYGSDKLSEMKAQSRLARQWQRIINDKSVLREICKH